MSAIVIPGIRNVRKNKYSMLKSLNWDLILNGMIRWTTKSNVIWYPLEPKAYYIESISSVATLKICLDGAPLHGEHQ